MHLPNIPQQWWAPILITVLLAFLVLLAAIIFLQIKRRKMRRQNNKQEETLRHYTAQLDALYDYLVGKGILTTGKTTIRDIWVEQKFSSIKAKMEELVDKYLQEEDRNQLAGTAQQPAVDHTPDAYIKAEIMLSAGPRKDAGNQDTELGEDVAGVVCLPGQTLFWLLDGTSDNTEIREEESHIFSSRLLAQNIGHYIQKNIAHYFAEDLALTTMLEQAAAQIVQDWTVRINQATPEKKAAIVRLLGQGFKPICSTTLLLGRLLTDGHLYALRTGDSKLFPFTRTPSGQLMLAGEFRLSRDPTTESDRIVFRLDYEEATGQFSIRTNTPRTLTETLKEVSCLFVFSDGIGRVTEAQLASNHPGVVEAIRQNVARIPQKTYDDKTLIILERILNH
jgi:hypothetical protein